MMPRLCTCTVGVTAGPPGVAVRAVIDTPPVRLTSGSLTVSSRPDPVTGRPFSDVVMPARSQVVPGGVVVVAAALTVTASGPDAGTVSPEQTIDVVTVQALPPA